MRKSFAQLLAGFIIAASAFLMVTTPFSGSCRPGGRTMSAPAATSKQDWFMVQRSYPHNDIPKAQFLGMRPAMKKFAALAEQRERSAFSQGEWRLAGPSNIGGRINAVVVNPNTQAIYAAAASGGVWKSTDFGGTWTVIFNESFSIGSLALNPANPGEMYVGTGEANPSSVDTYPGNGIWRSTDEGATWSNIGLAETGHIGKIVVNPLNPNTMYVAALGLYRGKNQDRGIYKSTNRGASWSRILFVNDSTGGTDVILDAADTSLVVAATWTYHRTLPYVFRGGRGSGISYSTDAGATWAVADGAPINDPNAGRICLAAAPSDPSVLYALAAGGGGMTWDGVYKSFDHGRSWIQTFVNTQFSESQVWYNNVIAVDPSNPDLVWAGMTYLYKSTDGGISFNYMPNNNQIHVDYHAITYWPGSSDSIVIGNDGGVFTSDNGGNDWSKSLNLPITQFYAGNISPHTPVQLMGGSQDNGSVRTYSVDPDMWDPFYGGDGFYCLIDPTDPSYVYAESQNGYMGYSTNGGASFNSGTNGLNLGETTNWCVPIALDPQQPKTLYTGTSYVYRTTDNMQLWTKISPNLTYNKGGFFSSLSTIDVSPVNSNVVWAGTGDGRVWNTTNGGSTWIDRAASLPLRWISRITCDPDSGNVAYVALSGFREYDFEGHLYRTRDYGATWQNIGFTLPDIPLNDVIVDPEDGRRLYVATDLNVLYTTNLGTTWQVLGSNLPSVPVHDLSLHAPSRTLAAFTHGRSVYTYVLPSPGSQSVQVSLQPKWNMVSNPLAGNNDSVKALFPNAISKAYAFSNAYLESPQLQSGVGYWLKFPDNVGAGVTLSGQTMEQDTVAVHAGWNMIGSVSSDIPVTRVLGLGTTIQTRFFGYSGIYATSDTIKSGKGYWVKVSADGQLILGVPAVAAGR